jgi:hypothetical protein
MWSSPYNLPLTHRGGVEVYFYSFLNLGEGWKCVVNATPRPLYPRERDPVTLAQEVGRAPGPAWKGAENLAPPAFAPLTVQPVANRYTNYAIPVRNSIALYFEHKK